MDLHDLELRGAARGLHLDLFALAMAHQRAADGRLERNAAIAGIDLGRADDDVGLLVAVRDVPDGDRAAQVDRVLVAVLVDDLRVAQDVPEVRMRPSTNAWVFLASS